MAGLMEAVPTKRVSSGTTSILEPSGVLTSTQTRNISYSPAASMLRSVSETVTTCSELIEQLYIYDLNNPTNPMPPGTTSTKLKEITSLQWNPTVARIFAASSSSGFTSVWDLRTSKEIASMQYGGGAAKGMDARASAAGLQMGKRRGMSDVCWHPDQVGLARHGK